MNLDRARAKNALAVVQELENKTKEEQGHYGSYVKGLPAAILQNGLGQAMATLLSASKGKPARESAHRRLYDHLEAWLCRNEKCAPYKTKTDDKPALMEAITSRNETQYLIAQAEALAYLQWLKKFSNAYLSIDTSQTNDSTESTS